MYPNPGIAFYNDSSLRTLIYKPSRTVRLSAGCYYNWIGPL